MTLREEAARGEPSHGITRATWTRLEEALDWLGRHDRLAAKLAIAFVILVGAGYAATLGSQLRFPDEHDYVTIATNLAHRGTYSLDGVTPTAFRPPGYPTLLAALQVLGIGVRGARLANVVMLALTVAGVWVLARRVGGPRVAALAVCVSAIYPLFTYTAGTLYSQTMAGVFFIWALVALVACLDAETARRRALLAAGGGLLFSICFLTVPTFGASLIGVLIWMAFVRRRRALPLVAVTVIAAAILPTAWTVRNAIIFHALVPVSTNNGLNLLEGNSENTNPTAGNLTDLSRYGAGAKQYTDEVERSDYYARAALSWIAANKVQAAVLYLEKTANYFNPRNDLVTSSQQSRLNDVLSIVSYVPLLLLFVGRLARFRSRPIGSVEALLIGLYVGNAFVLAIYYTKVRYRVPLDPLLILVAASFVVSLASGRRTRQRVTTPQAG
jgi:4-amino-4-deoxy-L-arabinose transferase-like glycosyltransferase